MTENEKTIATTTGCCCFWPTSRLPGWGTPVALGFEERLRVWPEIVAEGFNVWRSRE